MRLASLTKTGRAAIARAIAERPLHLAWGTGDPAWDDPDADLPSLVDATALVNEVGRRVTSSVGYVVPDDAGNIVIPTGIGADGDVQEARYSSVPGPTPHIYIRVNYNFADASNVIIREVGLFMDTVVKAELPPGQRYFTPAELDSPGLLLAAQIIQPAIQRSPAVRQSIEFVLPI